MIAQRNDHNIVHIRPMEATPLSRGTQVRLDLSGDELYLHEAVARACIQSSSRLYNDTVRTVREDFVRDAVEEAVLTGALGLDERQLLQGLRQVYGFHQANALHNRLDRIQEIGEIYTTLSDSAGPGPLRSIIEGLLNRGERRQIGSRR